MSEADCCGFSLDVPVSGLSGSYPFRDDAGVSDDFAAYKNNPEAPVLSPDSLACAADLETVNSGRAYRWSCPRAATNGGRCVFHDPESTDDEVARRFREALSGPPDPSAFPGVDSESELGRRAKQFVGLRAGTLDLAYAVVRGDDSVPIDLSFADVGTIDFRSVEMDRAVDLSGAAVDDLTLEGATVGNLALRHASFGRLSCAETRVRGSVEGRAVEVSGGATLAGAEVDGEVDFDYAKLRGGLDVERGRIGAQFGAKEAFVGGDLLAAGVSIEGRALHSDVTGFHLRGTWVRGAVDCRQAEIDGTVMANEGFVLADLDLSNAEITGNVWLSGVISEVALLRRLRVGGSVDLTGALVGGDVDLARPADRDHIAEVCGETSVDPVAEPARTDYGAVAVGGSLHARGVTVGGTLRLPPDFTSDVHAGWDVADADDERRTEEADDAGDGAKSRAAPRRGDDRRPRTSARTDAIDLTGADVASGRFDQPFHRTAPMLYDLSGGTTGNIEVRGGGSGRDSPYRYVRFVETKFTNFEFEKERTELRGAHWNVHDVSPDRYYDLYRGRVTRTAEGYAKDFFLLCAEMPGVRALFVESAGEFTCEALGEHLFGRNGGEVELKRIAHNGPENTDLPARIEANEELRRGVVTLVAGRLSGHRSVDEDDHVDAIFGRPGVRETISSMATHVEWAGSTAADLTSDQTAVRYVNALTAEIARGIADRADVDALCPTAQEVESTYLYARRAASDRGDNVATSEFYVREKRYRRKGHWAALGADTLTDRVLTSARRTLGRVNPRRRPPYVHPVRAETGGGRFLLWNALTSPRTTYDWFANLVFSALTGYGERYSRVVYASAVVVGVFAALYSSSPALPWWRGGMLSIESFVGWLLTGYPDIAFQDPMLRYLTDVEAFLGAFLVALFVFTLTRSLNR
ncbi:MAG: hypothetical protein ABEJ28_06125 [Salinigranum sp.]